MPDERVVVIGAGVGGLVSAALLAARGHDVTLVEAANGPGGKLRTITVDGSAIDAGPTVFTMRDVFANIFTTCGASLENYVTMRPATTLARHAWGDARLDLFADPDASEEAIGNFAGAADARGYRAFRTEAERIFRALDRPFLRNTKTDPLTLGWRMGTGGFIDYCTLRPYTSLWRALGGYFRDPRLRQLFARYATYCGSSPFKSPATLMLIAHVEARGVWLIDGGMHRIVLALEDLGRCNGAKFHYGAAVSEILVEGGRTTGVLLTNGERIAARSVVCNADPPQSARAGLGRQRRAPLPRSHRAAARWARWSGRAARKPPAFR